MSINLIFFIVIAIFIILLGIFRASPSLNSIVKQNEEEEKIEYIKTKLREEEIKKQEKQQEEQQGYYKQMIVIGEESISFFEGLPKYLESAEKYLDQAEINFTTVLLRRSGIL